MTAEQIERSLEEIRKTLKILRSRNRTLYKLLHLFRYFNHPEWIIELGKLNKASKAPKRRYPIMKIMQLLRCNQRTAYDYSITMDALGHCLNLYNDSLFLLAYASEMKKDGRL